MRYDKICPLMSPGTEKIKCIKEECAFWIDRMSHRREGLILTRVNVVEDDCVFIALLRGMVAGLK